MEKESFIMKKTPEEKKLLKEQKKARRKARNKKNLPIFAAVVVILLALFGAYKIVNFNIEVNANIEYENAGGQAPQAAVQVVAPVSSEPVSVAPAAETKAPAADAKTDAKAEDSSVSDAKPQTNEEIVKKYAELLNKMKQDQPAYTKKEYQALPEEYRNFSSVINKFLQFGEAYMTKEDDPKAIVSATKGEIYTADDGTTMPRINHELPICNTDKGCVLTDYSCVKSAECIDNANGTRTLKFELNDEKNPEPTPADTAVPVSYHGAVMMPASMKDINTEVDKVVSKLPGVAVNNFELTYCDSTFQVTYDPTNDHVTSIIHHINVDIAANAKVAFSTIDGTARLTNDMDVYDIQY